MLVAARRPNQLAGRRTGIRYAVDRRFHYATTNVEDGNDRELVAGPAAWVGFDAHAGDQHYDRRAP